MKNETKAALGLGLLIIFSFGFVVIQVKGPLAESALRPPEATGGEFTRRALAPEADDIAGGDYVRQPPRRVRRAGPLVRRAMDGGAPAGPAARSYTVQRNDSLARIARKVYGTEGPKYYTLIFEANRDKLPDIATVRAGQVLTIPPHPDGAPVRSARFGAGAARGAVAVGDGQVR